MKKGQQKSDWSIITTVRWLLWTKHFEFTKLLCLDPNLDSLLHYITFQVYKGICISVDCCLVSEQYCR